MVISDCRLQIFTIICNRQSEIEEAIILSVKDGQKQGILALKSLHYKAQFENQACLLKIGKF